MPFDTSMYRTQPVNVLDVIGGYQNISLKNQQKQQNALELQQAQAMAQEKQRALAEMMDVKNVLAGAGGSREEAVRALEAKGYYKPADELRKAAAEDAYKRAQTEHVGSQMKKEEAETQVKQQEALSRRLSQYKDFLGMVKTPQDAVTWVSAQYNDPITKDFVSKVPMDQMIQSIPQTPAEFEAWRNETGMGIEKFVQNKTTIRGQDVTAQTSRANNADTNARAAADNAANRGVQLKIATMTDARARDIAEQTDKRTRELAKNPAEKNLTEDQGKATSWLERMDQAEAVVRSAPKEALTSTGSIGGIAGATISGIPYLGNTGAAKMARNLVESPERQAVRTAQEAWVAGLLRSDTGAAYKDMEKDDIIRTFFPQPGEDDSQVLIKQNLRDGVRRAMLVRAGPGVERLNKVPKADANNFTSEAEVEAAFKAGKIKKGDTVIVNGRKAVWE